MARLLPAVAALTTVFFILGEFVQFSPAKFDDLLRSPAESFCLHHIVPAGYQCSEITIETKDGYLSALHRVSSSHPDSAGQRGPPVLLQHGLFMDDDGDNSFHIAAETAKVIRENLDWLIVMLRNPDADVEVRNHSGKTLRDILDAFPREWISEDLMEALANRDLKWEIG